MDLERLKDLLSSSTISFTLDPPWFRDPQKRIPFHFFARLHAKVARCKWTQASSHLTAHRGESRVRAGPDQTTYVKGALVCQRVWYCQKGCCHLEPGDLYISGSFMVSATHEILLGRAMSQSHEQEITYWRSVLNVFIWRYHACIFPKIIAGYR